MTFSVRSTTSSGRNSSHPDSDTDQRTKWEVEVWDKKVKKLFADDGISFLTNLRNFSMHYSIPPLTLTTRLHSHTGGPVLMENVVALRRDELLKYTRWNGPARRFISAHDGDIEFLSVVATYSTRVREFYGWFWQQVEDEVRSSLDEFLGKSNEYGHWLKVEHTMPEFGPDGRPVRGSFRRKRAEARQERAAFGTRGWRLIQPNEHGEFRWSARPARRRYHLVLAELQIPSSDRCNFPFTGRAEGTTHAMTKTNASLIWKIAELLRGP